MISRYVKENEDSLTSTVFSHLLHLPVECFWSIIREATFGDELPDFCGEPNSIEFWPHWNAEGTENSYYVEPDLFLRFPKFDLIIEAKRWDEYQQNPDQWRSQFRAYRNEYAVDQKPVMMLAVGGLFQDESLEIGAVGEETHQCLVMMTQWRRLLDVAKRHEREVSRLRYPSSVLRSQQRILADLINLFAHHGFSTGRWFDDFSFSANHLSSTHFSLQFS